MAKNQVKRRLAAILAADVVGYSRLMGADEVGTLSALKGHRKAVVDPAIAQHDGRIVKTTGDGMLVEFASAHDAVRCAAAIQHAMIARNADVAADERIVFRVGVNVGDIIIDGDDIFGDGVNVAARLESICAPGGVCISRSVHDQIVDRLSFAFADLGEQRVKNIARPVEVFGLDAEAVAGLPQDDLQIGGAPADSAGAGQSATAGQQEIRYCLSPDGTQIAYSTMGAGPPIVKAPNWMTHLEFEMESPLWRHMLDFLSDGRTLIRFDQRANGLSDWDVESISFDDFVTDLETVVDAMQLERFPLVGISQGCAISAAYAVRHPERVERLVLYGGFTRGAFKRGPAEKEQAEALITLIRHGWGKDNPAFRQMFTSSFVPEGTPEQMNWFNELMRASISAENAARLRAAVFDIDVTELLPRVNCPTLVLHCRDDAVNSFSEGRRLAASIPGARFVELDSKNHLILEHEPAWTRFRDEVESFLAA